MGRKHFSVGANIFHKAANISQQARTFSIGREHFSSGAKVGRQYFSQAANISQQTQTFFIGCKHFSSSAKVWRKSFLSPPIFQKQSMQGAKQSPKSKSKSKKRFVLPSSSQDAAV
jgi:hypothetical protein